MNTKLLRILTCVLLSIMMAMSSEIIGFAEDNGSQFVEDEYVEGEVLILFTHDVTTEEEIRDIISQYRVTLKSISSNNPPILALCEVPEGMTSIETVELINKNKDSRIRSVGLNIIFTTGEDDDLPEDWAYVWKRIPGTNRYFTMQNISEEGWEDGSCEAVVLALGTDFPDALAGTALAGIHDCPVLLTPGNALAPQAASEIERLGASTVYIVGGSGVIYDSVKTSVETLTGVQQVIRLAGNNRYDTSYEIYEEGIGDWSDTLILVTGMDFPDALAIAPYAGANKSPIFLINAQGDMTSAMQSAVSGGAFDKAVIIGGTTLVPASTENYIKGILGTENVLRLAGTNRYQTSSLVSNWASGEMTGVFQPDTVLDYAHVSLVNAATEFADALPGAAFAGHLGSIMLLTQNVASNTNHTVQNNVLLHIDDIDLGYIIGGTGALSDAFEAYLEGLAS